jgi:hypothetical protein
MLKARALLVVLLTLVMMAPYSSIARAAAPGTTTAATTATRALGVGSRIPWQGQDWYLHGANMPYLNWGRDFGGGSKDGVSNRDNYAMLSQVIGDAKAQGTNVIRWWTLEGIDPWQIKKDRSGAPVGLDEAVYADFDAAMALAEEHDVYYDFVLFSAPSHLPKSWLSDDRQRKQLANALAPLFARYKDNPHVLSWEPYNEPDHDVWENKVTEDQLRASVKEMVDAIHANSNAYATLGMLMLDGLPMSKGLGLDYYQAHWYDYMSSGDYCARCRTYEEVQKQYDLDGPLVIGEMYVGDAAEDPLERLEDFYNKGYAGAWPWAGLLPEATNDKMNIQWDPMRIFAGNHPDLGPRTGDALGAANITMAERLTITSSADVSPQNVAPGQKVTIKVQVTASTEVKSLVAIQMFHMTGGDPAVDKQFDDQSFAAGETKTFTTDWTVPASAKPGDYVVKVGVFRPHWGQGGKSYDYNDSAAVITVSR